MVRERCYSARGGPYLGFGSGGGAGRSMPANTAEQEARRVFNNSQCIIHNSQFTILSHKGTNYIKKVIKKLIFMQKLIHIHLYTVDY